LFELLGQEGEKIRSAVDHPDGWSGLLRAFGRAVWGSYLISRPSQKADAVIHRFHLELRRQFVISILGREPMCRSYVCFAPDSGHLLGITQCPLSARSGHPADG
jgi:hypothetical protein